MRVGMLVIPDEALIVVGAATSVPSVCLVDGFDEGTIGPDEPFGDAPSCDLLVLDVGMTLCGNCDFSGVLAGRASLPPVDELTAGATGLD